MAHENDKDTVIQDDYNRIFCHELPDELRKALKKMTVQEMIRFAKFLATEIDEAYRRGQNHNNDS